MSETKKTIKTIKRMYSYTGEAFWKWGIVRLVGGVGSATLNMLYSKVFGSLIDVVFEAEVEFLIRFMLTLIAIVLVRSALGYSNVIAYVRYDELCAIKYRKDAIEKINMLPLSYFDNEHSGSAISKVLNDISKIKLMYGNSMSSLWSYIPAMLIVGTTLLVTISWKLTLICLVVILPVTYLFNKITLPIAESAQKMQESTGKVNSFLKDFIEGNDIYKVFAMRNSHAKKFLEACDETTRYSVDIEKRRRLLTAVSICCHLFPWILAYSVGGIYVTKGEISIGQLYAFSMIMGSYSGSIWKIALAWSEMVEAAGRARNFFKLLDNKTERNDGRDYSGNDSKSCFEFRNVSFGYEMGEQVLCDCSLSVNKGEKIALVGSSGSGKSTVQKLLCGFYDNYEGAISYNGYPLNEWNLKSLRENISFVSQDTFLFNDSFMENIRFGRTDASDEAVIDAAKKAFAHDFIMKSHSGYNSLVGERGIRLSEGERQRIAIARAILKNSAVILMDEPTSSLDTKSEYYVKSALANLEESKTILTIAHRLSTIEKADKIMVLDDGKIVETGTHAELMNLESRYFDLYNLGILKEDSHD